MKGTYILLILLVVGLGCYAQTASRLVGFATRYNDSTKPYQDTGIYNKYSMDRGGEMRVINSQTGDNILRYDFPTYREGITKFDSVLKINNSDTQFCEQFFDDANNIIRARNRFVDNNNIIRDTRTVTCKYDGNNNLLEQVDTLWTYYGTYSVRCNQYTYDSKNNVSSYIRFSLEKSDTTAKAGQTSFYDNENRIIAICYQYWYKATHSFLTGEFTHFFYTGDQLDSTYSYAIHAKKNGLDTLLKWYSKYYYSFSKDTTIIDIFWTYGPPYPGALNHRFTTVYNANHNIVLKTTEYSDFIGKDLSSRFEYAYNSFNQVTSEKYYGMNDSGEWRFSHLFRYYYETYDPGPPYVKNDLEIYPSPTKSELTLKLLWQDAQPFAVCIYNSVGQRIMQWDEPAIKEYKKTISLPGLASGNYFIQVNSGKQRIVKKFVIN